MREGGGLEGRGGAARGFPRGLNRGRGEMLCKTVREGDRRGT